MVYEKYKKSVARLGFTIIELVIIVVVIGILVGIVAISYSGIISQNKVAVVETDLRGAATEIMKTFYDTGSFPVDTSGLSRSEGTSYGSFNISGVNFCLEAISSDGDVYHITKGTAPKVGACQTIPFNPGD